MKKTVPSPRKRGRNRKKGFLDTDGQSKTAIGIRFAESEFQIESVESEMNFDFTAKILRQNQNLFFSLYPFLHGCQEPVRIF